MDKIKKAISKMLHSRSMKYGTNSMIMVVAVLGIAILLNAVFTLTNLKNLSFDLTPNKLYSIGDQTKDILKGLNKDVTIYGLFDEERQKSGDDKPVIEMLKQYDLNSHVKVIYKDPDKNPTLMSDIDPDNTKGIQKGNYVIKCGSKLRTLTINDMFSFTTDQSTGTQTATGFKAEEEFTGAIKFVTSDKAQVAYFVSGHQEQNADANYTQAKSYIEKNNFEIKDLKLATADKVPADASILVFLSPKNDLSVDEREKLRDYFKTGGNALFLFDSDKTGVALNQFNTLLGDFNLALDNDVVKENDSNFYYPHNQYMIVPQIQSNGITSKLDSSALMFMYNARSIKIQKTAKDYINITELANTSDSAVGEQVTKNQGNTISGPLDLAVAVESAAYSKPAKIVVFGNSQFIDDAMVSNVPSSIDFLMSSINWIQDNKNDISIVPKENVDMSMILTTTQENIIKWGTILVLPLLIMIVGIVVWLRRRHL